MNENVQLALAAIIGFCIGWLICSLWAVRMVDTFRRHLRESLESEVTMRDIRQDYERLKHQEELNRTRM